MPTPKLSTNKRVSPKARHLPPDFAPQFCTFNEACTYARCGRFTGYRRVEAGRWKSFKDDGRHMVVFASVVEDLKRQQAASEPVTKRKPGRPRKHRPETANASAAE